MWRRFKILTGLLIVFLAGVAVGGIGVIRIVQKKVAFTTDPARWESTTMAWLTKELSLTTEQQDKVKPAVHDEVEQLKGLRDRTDAERKAVVATMLFKVSETLTEPQRDALRKLIEKGKRNDAKHPL